LGCFEHEELQQTAKQDYRVTTKGAQTQVP